MTDQPTTEEILDWIDPDWREHFGHDVDRAAVHYQKYAWDEWWQAIRDLES